MWFDGLMIALSPENLLWLVIGSSFGLIIGVLPAIGANLGVALVLPFTFGMEPTSAIILLCAIHAAANYGDSVASILLNTPGGPGTVATCWDGYPLSQKGQGGRALGIATFGSFAGGVLGCIALIALAKPLTELALRIGSPEYFALGVMALSLISVGSKGETVKGIMMACLGLALSFIGGDPVSGLVDRFAFGVPILAAGIPIVVSTLGVFAIAQAIEMLGEGGSIAGEAGEFKDSVLGGLIDVVRRPMTLLRSGMVGLWVGVLPALGVSLAGIASYLFEKKYSKEAGEFGKGAPGGLLAAETGKGACVVGDLIPTFTLGVPGSVTGALLMAALIVHGIAPGPMFLLSGAMPYAVFMGIILAQAVFLISGLLLARYMAKIVYVPNAILAPGIVVICVLGSYAERNSVWDIAMMLGFGILAYALNKAGYSVVCLVLGLILGNLVETNFHRALSISEGSLSIFVTRPMTLAMLLITALFLAGPWLSAGWKALRGCIGAKPSGSAACEAPAEPAAAEPVKDKPAAKEELVVLAALLVVAAGMLVIGRQYSPAVAMFPNLVAGIMLALALWHGIGLLRGGVLKTRWQITAAPSGLFVNRLSWHWAVISLLGFLGVMWLFGFLVAAAAYMAAVPLMLGYRKPLVVIGAGLLTPVILYALAGAFKMFLPGGILMG